MFVLGIMTLSIANGGQARFILLLLVLLAVALILVGGIIALLTLLRQRKTYGSRDDSVRLESERT
jgi:high-affinity Fe2+/Pb2+ permease